MSRIPVGPHISVRQSALCKEADVDVRSDRTTRFHPLLRNLRRLHINSASGHGESATPIA